MITSPIKRAEATRSQARPTPRTSPPVQPLMTFSFVGPAGRSSAAASSHSPAASSRGWRVPKASPRSVWLLRHRRVGHQTAPRSHSRCPLAAATAPSERPPVTAASSGCERRRCRSGERQKARHELPQPHRLAVCHRAPAAHRRHYTAGHTRGQSRPGRGFATSAVYPARPRSPCETRPRICPSRLGGLCRRKKFFESCRIGFLRQCDLHLGNQVPLGSVGMPHPHARCP